MSFRSTFHPENTSQTKGFIGSVRSAEELSKFAESPKHKKAIEHYQMKAQRALNHLEMVTDPRLFERSSTFLSSFYGRPVTAIFDVRRRAGVSGWRESISGRTT